MNVSCRAKLPDVFDVRVTGIGLRLLKETVIPYNHSTVENFNITVTVGVEVCTDLRMKIRGRNSGGRTSNSLRFQWVSASSVQRRNLGCMI